MSTGVGNNDLLYTPIYPGKIYQIYPSGGLITDILYYIYLSTKYSLFSKNFRELYIDRVTKSLSRYFSAEKIFLTDSGRSALVIAMKSLGIGDGGEVLVSAFNCSAIADAICALGAEPKFVDCNDNGGLSVESLKVNISPKTRALIVTNVYGIIDELQNIREICDKNRVALINDLAQSFEFAPLLAPLNRYGDISVYSFGPEKHLSACGGGALLSYNKNIIKKIADNMPNDAITTTETFGLLFYKWKYYLKFHIACISPMLFRKMGEWGIIEIFNNSKSSNDIEEPKVIFPRKINYIQLCVVLRRFKMFHKVINKSKDNFLLLANILGDSLIAGASVNDRPPLYATIRVPVDRRYELSLALSKEKIQTVWNYLPLYMYKAYSQFEKMPTPRTDRLWKEVLSVPFRYPIKRSKVAKIAEIIKNF